MARLGPFGPAPLVCAAVSGGADSTALALLARDWALAQGGGVLALIVDHGLRQGSAAEAALTQDRLAARGIETRVLTISGLNAGPKLQELARAARYGVLADAVRKSGAVFLLLGHHAADQSETVAMRASRGGGGLEGMAGGSDRETMFLVRPLLNFQPAVLRAYLTAANMPWVEDPSNADRRFERVRLRQAGAAAAADPAARMARDNAVAVFLARHAVLRPEGFAVIAADQAPPAALAALLRVVGGGSYAPAQAAVAALAAQLKPASLGSVLLVKSERLGGWLLAREPAACAPPIPTETGRIWDRRFQLREGRENFTCGALGMDAAKFRSRILPAVVLRSMPCLRSGPEIIFPASARFTPPGPAIHPFSPGQAI